ncbi:MAG: N-acetylmuramoyl-L-alanine amidase [Dokdonella sp.]
MTWNNLVPADRRFATAMKTTGRPMPRPSHVVCHITGSDSFASVKKTFLTSVSAHYVVDKAGVIYQFVQEDDQAWHAGIARSTLALYAQGAQAWRKYLFYFEWTRYPIGSVFVDENLQPVEGGRVATFVRRADGADWPHYAYFDQRWGAGTMPANYATSQYPNAYSVGIEILSLGATKASDETYTPAMYRSLRSLVTDICARQAIPMQKGHVLGHEDVNPVQRYGWDPNQGFDWTQVWA